VVETVQDRDPGAVHPSQPLAGFRSPLVTTLLQATRSNRGDKVGDSRAPELLLTVREAAAILKVSTATVYALVKRGELPHVRVSNAIRIVLNGSHIGPVRADGAMLRLRSRRSSPQRIPDSSFRRTP
jgi:excisionase family DNA binding protein